MVSGSAAFLGGVSDCLLFGMVVASLRRQEPPLSYHAEKKGNRLPRPERPALPLTMGHGSSFIGLPQDMRKVRPIGIALACSKGVWEEPSSLARSARPEGSFPYEGEEDVKFISETGRP